MNSNGNWYVRLRSSSAILGCSVQCVNETRKPETTVLWWDETSLPADWASGLVWCVRSYLQHLCRFLACCRHLGRFNHHLVYNFTLWRPEGGRSGVEWRGSRRRTILPRPSTPPTDLIKLSD